MLARKIPTFSGKLEYYTPNIMSLPLIILLVGVFVIPLIGVAILSFTRWIAAGGSISWVGWGNYLEAFSDERFRAAIWRNFYFSTSTTLLQIFLGLLIALLLDAKISGVKIYRTLVMIPMMCAPIVVSLTWRFMLNRTFGVINYFIENLGLERVSFLGETNLVIPTLILVEAWQWTPYAIIVLLAGLQAIPPEPLEAAELDGVNFYQRLYYIILPLIKPHMLAVGILRFITEFKNFDIIWGMTRGGPSYASETLYPFIFSQAFLYFRIGYGSATTIIFLIMIFILGFAFNSLRGREA